MERNVLELVIGTAIIAHKCSGNQVDRDEYLIKLIADSIEEQQKREEAKLPKAITPTSTDAVGMVSQDRLFYGKTSPNQRGQ
jgi:hypothetical protein